MQTVKVSNRADLAHHEANNTEIIRLALSVIKQLSSCQYGGVVFALRYQQQLSP